MFKFLLMLLLASISSITFAHGVSVEDQALLLNAGWIDYMQLGAMHMLTGYDHLLFLFAVIFFLTKFNDVIKFITAFTVGHSITLIFATLFGIQANYYLIDAVIALTVCYKAFDNLEGFKKYFSLQSPNLMWAVFIIGLIHGFGLSTRLQQLPLSESGLIAKILAFNVGVEIGQIAALSFMLILLSGWRKTHSFNLFSKASNVLLIFIGGLLFIMQLHNFQHTQHPLMLDTHEHSADSTERLESEENARIEAILEAELHSHDGVNFHTH